MRLARASDKMQLKTADEIELSEFLALHTEVLQHMAIDTHANRFLP